MSTEKTYTSFWDFYPYYLTEHARPLNRRLHFIGTLLVILFLILGVAFREGWLFIAIPLCGYGFAWVGHFVFEKNRPATFKYPFYSLGSDFVMFYQTLTGQIEREVDKAHKMMGIVNPWK